MTLSLRLLLTLFYMSLICLAEPRRETWCRTQPITPQLSVKTSFAERTELLRNHSRETTRNQEHLTSSELRRTSDGGKSQRGRQQCYRDDVDQDRPPCGTRGQNKHGFSKTLESWFHWVLISIVHLQRSPAHSQKIQHHFFFKFVFNLFYIIQKNYIIIFNLFTQP